YIELAESSPVATTDRGGPRSFSQSRQAVLSNEDLVESSSFDFLYGRDRLLPTGPCSVVATIVADVLPEGSKGLERTVGFGEWYGTPKQAQEWMSTHRVLNETMGANWQRKLLQGRSGITMDRGGDPGGSRQSFTTGSTVTNVEIVQG